MSGETEAQQVQDPNRLAALIAEPLTDPEYEATMAMLGVAPIAPDMADTVAFLGGVDEAIEENETPEKESGSDLPAAAKGEQVGAGAEGDAPAGGEQEGSEKPATAEGAGDGGSGDGGAAADPGAGSNEPGPEGATAGAAVAEGATAGAVAAEEPERGILSADGKTILPYEMWDLAKSQNERLRAENESLRRERMMPAPRVSGADAGGDPGVGAGAGTGPDGTAQPAPVDTSKMRTTLEKVKADYADENLSELLDSMVGTVETVVKENADLRKDMAADTQAFQADNQRALERDIETNPDLSKWQADYDAFMNGDLEKSPIAYQDARELDDRLVLRPEWQDRPRLERFAHVVKMVKMMNGEAPSSGTPSASGGEADPKPKPAPVDVDKLVREARKTPLPESIGDIAGAAPGADTDDPTAEMSMLELEEHMMGFNSDQRAAFIASL